MPGVTFASNLREDRSVTLPEQAVDELGLHAGDALLVRVEAARRSRSAQRSLRRKYVRALAADLHAIAQHCGAPSAISYADRILGNLRAIRDHLPTDPFVHFATALYDALAYKQRWSEFSAAQFEVAREVVLRVSQDANLTQDQLDRAIGELEDAGIDTLPYEVEIDLDEDAA